MSMSGQCNREGRSKSTCKIYRLDPDAEELALAGSDPEDAPAASPQPGGTGLVLDLMRRAGARGRGGRRKVARALWPDVDENALLVAPLVAGDEQLGVLCCLAREGQFSEEDAELLGAVANQTAVGLKKAELIERLTAENIVKDMFDALAAGSVEAAEAKAGEARNLANTSLAAGPSFMPHSRLPPSRRACACVMPTKLTPGSTRPPKPMPEDESQRVAGRVQAVARPRGGR